MQSINRAMKRISFLCAKPLQFSPPVSATSIPHCELVDEEINPGYNPKHYYPAKPGEDLANHYQLLVKIGWGVGSTVWLARDVARHVFDFHLQSRSAVASLTFRRLFRRDRWQTERLVALKIINNDSPKGACHERDIEEHIGQQNPSHRGRPVVRNCLDSFEVTGPIGNHLCLAYEPAREPLWILQKRFETERLPLSMAKGYILISLAGLDYLHSECRVVTLASYPVTLGRMN
jgi:serine/threonine protein kinase